MSRLGIGSEAAAGFGGSQTLNPAQLAYAYQSIQAGLDTSINFTYGKSFTPGNGGQLLGANFNRYCLVFIALGSNELFINPQIQNTSAHPGIFIGSQFSVIGLNTAFYGAMVQAAWFGLNFGGGANGSIDVIELTTSLPVPGSTVSPESGLRRLQQAGLIPGVLTAQQECSLQQQIEAIVKELKGIYLPTPGQVAKSVKG